MWRSVRSIKRNIRRLIDAGAKEFLVANLPDLSRVPGVAGPVPSMFVDVDVAARPLWVIESRVHRFNYWLNRALNRLEVNNPSVDFYRFDVFALLDAVLDAPEQLGFALDTATPLLDEEYLFVDLPQIWTPGEPLPEDYLEQLLQNAPNARFWDGVHPTSLGHFVIAHGACEAKLGVGHPACALPPPN